MALGARVTKMGIGIGNQLPTHATAIPGRLAQQVKKPLALAIRHRLGHLLQVTPPTLEQPMQVKACRALDRAGEPQEGGMVGREVAFDMRERSGDQRGNVVGEIELTSN